MKMPRRIEPANIAPCGVNCLTCSAHLNDKKACPGCRASDNEITRKSCRNCVKKKCAFAQGFLWCFQCHRFPCVRIKSLNQRYLQNYAINLVQNGQDAKRDMNDFLEIQRKRFICTVCGGIVDQHHRKCSECGSII